MRSNGAKSHILLVRLLVTSFRDQIDFDISVLASTQTIFFYEKERDRYPSCRVA